MSGRPVKKGTTNVSSVVRIIDSSDGSPETGVVAATGGLAFNYRREAEVAVAITGLNNLALLTTAHTDGGILHIGDGYYRVDFQDAAFAVGAGEDGVLLTGTATGMIVIGTYHPLVDYDPYDPIRMGLTALPAAAADAAGGLTVSDAGALDLDAMNTSIGAIETDTSTTLQAELDAIQAAVITNAAGVDIAADIIAIKAETATILVDTGTTLDAAIAVVDANVDQIETAVITNAAGTDIAADIIAIKAETATILVDTSTTLQAELDAIQAAVITNAAGTDIAADIIAIKAETATILVDTSTTLQAELDAIQAAVITNAAGVDIAADIIALKAETVLILVDTGTTLDDHLTDIKGTAFVKDTHSLIDIEAYVDILDDATSGNVKIATDVAATLVDTGTTIPATITTLQADTDDIQTRLPAALVGGLMSSDVTAISTSTAAADNLEAHALETLSVTFTTAGGSVTAAVLNLVDGSAASTTDDVYNGRILVFNNGTLDHQITEITDYVGSTKTATITAVTVAPTSSHTARMV